MMWIQFIAGVLIFGQVNAYYSGAPIDACSNDFSLSAAHGAEPQSSPSPFLTLLNQTQVDHGSTVYVRLQDAELSNFFKGYLLMAYAKSDVNNVMPIGTFSDAEDDNGKTIGRAMDCPQGIKSAVTHNSNSYKMRAYVKWTPPEGFHGDVVFKATFVIDAKTHWDSVLSDTVNVAPNPDVTTSSTGTSTLTSRATTAATSNPTTSTYSTTRTSTPVSTTVTASSKSSTETSTLTEQTTTVSTTSGTFSTTSSTSGSSTPAPESPFPVALTVVLVVVGVLIIAAIVGYALWSYLRRRAIESRNYRQDL